MKRYGSALFDLYVGFIRRICAPDSCLETLAPKPFFAEGVADAGTIDHHFVTEVAGRPVLKAHRALRQSMRGLFPC